MEKLSLNNNMTNLDYMFDKKYIEFKNSFNNKELQNVFWKELIELNILICEEEAFGCWVDKIWISATESSFEDEKKLFLDTFLKLLKDNKIVIINDCIKNYKKVSNKQNIEKNIPKPVLQAPILEVYPNDNRYNYWNEKPEVIIEHIRHIFPKSVTSYEDLDLNYWFFLLCPRIGWIDPINGKLSVS
jgi:hypothetical protein